MKSIAESRESRTGAPLYLLSPREPKEKVDVNIIVWAVSGFSPGLTISNLFENEPASFCSPNTKQNESREKIVGISPAFSSHLCDKILIANASMLCFKNASGGYNAPNTTRILTKKNQRQNEKEIKVTSDLNSNASFETWSGRSRRLSWSLKKKDKISPKTLKSAEEKKKEECCKKKGKKNKCQNVKESKCVRKKVEWRKPSPEPGSKLISEMKKSRLSCEEKKMFFAIKKVGGKRTRRETRKKRKSQKSEIRSSTGSRFDSSGQNLRFPPFFFARHHQRLRPRIKKLISKKENSSRKRDDKEKRVYRKSKRLGKSKKRAEKERRQEINGVLSEKHEKKIQKVEKEANFENFTIALNNNNNKGEDREKEEKNELKENSFGELGMNEEECSEKRREEGLKKSKESEWGQEEERKEGMIPYRYLKIRHALRHYLMKNKLWAKEKSERGRLTLSERNKRCGEKCSGSPPRKCWRSAPLLCVPYVKKGQDDVLKFLIKALQKMVGRPFPPKADIFDKTKFKPSDCKQVDRPPCDDCDDDFSSSVVEAPAPAPASTCSTQVSSPTPVTSTAAAPTSSPCFSFAPAPCLLSTTTPQPSQTQCPCSSFTYPPSKSCLPFSSTPCPPFSSPVTQPPSTTSSSTFCPFTANFPPLSFKTPLPSSPSSPACGCFSSSPPNPCPLPTRPTTPQPLTETSVPCPPSTSPPNCPPPTTTPNPCTSPSTVPSTTTTCSSPTTSSTPRPCFCFPIFIPTSPRPCSRCPTTSCPPSTTTSICTTTARPTSTSSTTQKPNCGFESSSTTPSSNTCGCPQRFYPPVFPFFWPSMDVNRDRNLDQSNFLLSKNAVHAYQSSSKTASPFYKSPSAPPVPNAYVFDFPPSFPIKRTFKAQPPAGAHNLFGNDLLISKFRAHAAEPSASVPSLTPDKFLRKASPFPPEFKVSSAKATEERKQTREEYPHSLSFVGKAKTRPSFGYTENKHFKDSDLQKLSKSKVTSKNVKVDREKLKNNLYSEEFWKSFRQEPRSNFKLWAKQNSQDSKLLDKNKARRSGDHAQVIKAFRDVNGSPKPNTWKSEMLPLQDDYYLLEKPYFSVRKRKSSAQNSFSGLDASGSEDRNTGDKKFLVRRKREENDGFGAEQFSSYEDYPDERFLEDDYFREGEGYASRAPNDTASVPSSYDVLSQLAQEVSTSNTTNVTPTSTAHSLLTSSKTDALFWSQNKTSENSTGASTDLPLNVEYHTLAFQNNHVVDHFEKTKLESITEEHETADDALTKSESDNPVSLLDIIFSDDFENFTKNSFENTTSKFVASSEQVSRVFPSTPLSVIDYPLLSHSEKTQLNTRDKIPEAKKTLKSNFFQKNSKDDEELRKGGREKDLKKKGKNEEVAAPTTLEVACIVKTPKKSVVRPSAKAYSRIFPESFAPEPETNATSTCPSVTTSKDVTESNKTCVYSTTNPDLRLQLLAVCEAYLEVIKVMKAQNHSLGEELDADLARHCEHLISQSFNCLPDKPKKSTAGNSATKLDVEKTTRTPDSRHGLSFYEPLVVREAVNDLVRNVERSGNKESEIKGLEPSYEELRSRTEKDDANKSEKENILEEGVSFGDETESQSEPKEEQMEEELMRKRMSKELVELLRKRKRALLSWLFGLKQKTKNVESHNLQHLAKPDSFDSSQLSGQIKPTKEKIWSRGKRKERKKERGIPIYAKEYGYDKGGELREVEILWRTINEKTHQEKILKNLSVVALLLATTPLPGLRTSKASLVGNSGLALDDVPDLRFDKGFVDTTPNEQSSTLPALDCETSTTPHPNSFRPSDPVVVCCFNISTPRLFINNTSTSTTHSSPQTLSDSSSKVHVNDSTLTMPSRGSRENETSSTMIITNTTIEPKITGRPSKCKFGRTGGKASCKNSSHTIISKPDPTCIVGTPLNGSKPHNNATRKTSKKLEVAKDIIQEYTIEFLNYAVYILPIMFTILFLFCCTCCALHIIKVNKSIKRLNRKRKKVRSTDDSSVTTSGSETELLKKERDRERQRKRECKLKKKDEGGSDVSCDRGRKSVRFWNVLKMAGKSEEEEKECSREEKKRRHFLKFLRSKKEGGRDRSETMSLEQIKEREKWEKDKCKKNEDRESEGAERRELLELLEELKKIEMEEREVGEKHEQESKPLHAHYTCGRCETSGGYRLPELTEPWLGEPWTFSKKRFLRENALKEPRELTKLLPCHCLPYFGRENFVAQNWKVGDSERFPSFLHFFEAEKMNPWKKLKRNDEETRRLICEKYRNRSEEGSGDSEARSNAGAIRFEKETEQPRTLKKKAGEKDVRLRDEGVLCKL